MVADSIIQVCIFHVIFFHVVVHVFFQKVSQIPHIKIYFISVKSACLSTLPVGLSACLISAHMVSSWHKHVTCNESFLQLLCFIHTAKTMGKLSSLNFASVKDRVLLEELIITQLAKKLHVFSRIWRFLTVNTRSGHSILYWARLIHFTFSRLNYLKSFSVLPSRLCLPLQRDLMNVPMILWSMKFLSVVPECW